MAVNSFRSSAHVGHSVLLFLQTLKKFFKNRFEDNIYGKGNFELVSSTMESYKGIIFIVYTIFIVFVSQFLAVES